MADPPKPPPKPMTIGTFRNCPKNSKRPSNSQPTAKTISCILPPREVPRNISVSSSNKRDSELQQAFNVGVLSPTKCSAADGQKGPPLPKEPPQSPLKPIRPKEATTTANFTLVGVNETMGQRYATTTPNLNAMTFVGSLRPGPNVVTNSDPQSFTSTVFCQGDESSGTRVAQGMIDPLESVRIGVSKLTGRVWSERRLESGCRTDDEFAWKLLRAEANFMESNRFLASLAGHTPDDVCPDNRTCRRYTLASNPALICEEVDTAGDKDSPETVDDSGAESSGPDSVCRFHRQYSSSVSLLSTSLDDLRHCVKCGAKLRRKLMHKSAMLYALVCRRGHVLHVTKEMALGYEKHRVSSSRGCTLCNLWSVNGLNTGELLSAFIDSTSGRQIRIPDSVPTEHHDHPQPMQEPLLPESPQSVVPAAAITANETNNLVQSGPVRILCVDSQPPRRVSSRKLVSRKRTCLVTKDSLVGQLGAQSILRKRDHPPPETNEDRPAKIQILSAKSLPNRGINSSGPSPPATEGCSSTNVKENYFRAMNPRVVARLLQFGDHATPPSGGCGSPETTESRLPATPPNIQVSLVRNTRSGGKMAEVSCMAQQPGPSSTTSRYCFVDVGMSGEVTDSNGFDPRSSEPNKRFKSILKSRTEDEGHKSAFASTKKWRTNGVAEAECSEPIGSATGDVTGLSSLIKLEPDCDLVVSTGATYGDGDQVGNTFGEESVLCPIIKMEMDDGDAELDISDVSQDQMDQIVKMNEPNV